jgi:hypothetical protein
MLSASPMIPNRAEVEACSEIAHDTLRGSISLTIAHFVCCAQGDKILLCAICVLCGLPLLLLQQDEFLSRGEAASLQTAEVDSAGFIGGAPIPCIGSRRQFLGGEDRYFSSQRVEHSEGYK